MLLDHKTLRNLIETDAQVFLGCGPSPLEVAHYLDELLEFARALELVIDDVRARFAAQLDEAAKEV